MGTPIFKITDGTTSVNLITKVGSGIHTMEYIPNRPKFKDGGVWTDSSLADGRQMKMRKWDNVVDIITLGINGDDQDVIVEEARNLTELLEKAVYYFTAEWQNEPVWIERRGSKETETSYSLIYSYNWANDDDPFRPPFYVSDKNLSMHGIDLAIEHGFWLSYPPGTSKDVAISNDGRDATTEAEVFVANKTVTAQLTDCYYEDVGTGFSGNLIGAATPHNLLPAAPAVDDVIYFGSDEGPFSSLVFDLETSSGTGEFDWEYWDGAAWSPFVVIENVSGFRNLSETGVGKLVWLMPTDWETTAVNYTTAWWVRARVTSVGTIPSQDNRDIYTITNNSVEIDEDQLNGDITALCEIGFTSTSSTLGEAKKIIVAIRSVDRGNDFVSHINATNVQNNTDIETSGGTVVDSLYSQTGEVRQTTVSGDLSAQIAFTFNQPLSEDFYGRFRMYARIHSSGIAEGDLTSYAEISMGTQRVTKTVTNTSISDDYYYFDYGVVATPPSGLPTGFLAGFIIMLYAGGSATVNWIDLILIPVDEYAFEINQSPGSSSFVTTIVDSVLLIGKRDIFSTLSYDIVGDSYLATESGLDILTEGDERIILDGHAIATADIPRIIAPAPLQLQVDKNQKIYFFVINDCAYDWTGRILISANERYLTFRGDKQ